MPRCLLDVTGPLDVFLCQHVAYRIQVRDFNPYVGVERFQPFNKLKLPQRRLEWSALAARGLPRSSMLEAQRIKKLGERLELFGPGGMANCGDVLYHKPSAIS